MTSVPAIMNPTTLGKLKVINGCALSTTPTLHYSYRLTRAMIHENIPGDLVECGVYAGSQCGAMALAVQQANSNKVVHCFDSFSGFPKASENDDQGWRERLGVGDSAEPSNPLDPAWGFDSKMTVDRVKFHFSQWGFPLSMFEFHEGWFQDTVPKFNKPIALLRLDGDLYESTMVCLKHLYPLLSVGGVCIIDDYEVSGCRKAFDEYFAANMPRVVKFENSEPVWFTKE